MIERQEVKFPDKWPERPPQRRGSRWLGASQWHPTQAWRSRVEQYVNRLDRSVEPIFVGRQGHFKHLQSSLDAARTLAAPGNAIVISGAPGAGKTAFLSEMRRRSNSGELDVTVIPVSAKRLHDPPGV